MYRRKCKFSVFCILFLVLFSLGTICGVLFFRLLADYENNWIWAYGWSLLPLYRLGSYIRPLVLAGAMSLVTWGKHCVLLLVFCRGLLMSYAISAFYACGQDMGLLLVQGLVILPLFYLVCLWSYSSSAICSR